MCDFLKMKALVHTISNFDSKINFQSHQKQTPSKFTNQIKLLAFYIVTERLRQLSKLNTESSVLYQDLFTTILLPEMKNMLIK